MYSHLKHKSERLRERSPVLLHYTVKPVSNRIMSLINKKLYIYCTGLISTNSLSKKKTCVNRNSNINNNTVYIIIVNVV